MNKFIVLFIILSPILGISSAENQMKFDLSIEFYYFEWRHKSLRQRECTFQSTKLSCKWIFDVEIYSSSSSNLFEKRYEFKFRSGFSNIGQYTGPKELSPMRFKASSLNNIIIKLTMSSYYSDANRPVFQAEYKNLLEWNFDKTYIKNINHKKYGPILLLKTSVKCAESYYGTNCQFCFPIDGYFTCNTTTGERICSKGKIGRYCDQYFSNDTICDQSNCNCTSRNKEGFYTCEDRIAVCLSNRCANRNCKLNIIKNRCFNENEHTNEKAHAPGIMINIPMVYFYYAVGGFVGIVIIFIVIIAIVCKKRRPVYTHSNSCSMSLYDHHCRPLPIPPVPIDEYVKPTNSCETNSQLYENLQIMDHYIPLSSPLPQKA